MKITINRDLCHHGGAFADRCLAATIRNPLGHEHYCIAQVEEDGQPELTVVMILEGQAHTPILHNAAEKELAAAAGWPAFLQAKTDPASAYAG